MPQLQNLVAQLLIGHLVAPASGLENVRRVFVEAELVAYVLDGLQPGALDELKQPGRARCLGLCAFVECALASRGFQ